MQIVMAPGEVAKIPGVNGGSLPAGEVCLRAVSLLKNIVNDGWLMPTAQGQTADQSQTAQISKEDKDFIKANIFDSLAIARTTLKDKKIS